MFAEELCTPCLLETGEMIVMIELSPPRADGRHVCPGCGELGAKRTHETNPITGASITTIDLREP